jgi:hypothetical protein
MGMGTWLTPLIPAIPEVEIEGMRFEDIPGKKLATPYLKKQARCGGTFLQSQLLGRQR